MQQKLVDISGNTITALVITILFGLIAYGTQIFNFGTPYSSIIFFGLYGGLFYSVLKYGTVKEAWLTAAAVYILQLVIAGSAFHLAGWIRDAIYIAALLGAILLFHNYRTGRFRSTVLSTLIVLPVVYAVLQLAAVVLSFIIFRPSAGYFEATLFPMTRLAVLIGLALAAGFVLYEKYVGKFLTGNRPLARH